MSITYLRRTIFVSMLVLLIIFITPYVYGQGYSVEGVRERIYKAYGRVVDAYYSGGNVSKAVDSLNKAISYLYKYQSSRDQAYLREAVGFVDSVDNMIPTLVSEGESTRFWNNVLLIVSIAILATLALAAYLYLPKMFFRTWSRLRKNYKVVVRRSRSGRKSLILDEEVWAVILAIIVVGGVFAVSQAYLSGRVVEPFSELGLLGRNMKIGDYPRNLIVGDNATFYVYVGNHMGRPMYYVVEVKLGNRSTAIDPSPLEPIYVYERILMHNETWIFRVDLPVERAGLNQRIIVELWIYNESIGELQYHGRWTQLWINVTSV